MDKILLNSKIDRIKELMDQKTSVGYLDMLLNVQEVQFLAEALKINTTLTTLKLYLNALDDKGVQILVEALKINTTLTTLNIWSNEIGNQGAQALAEALKMNTTLTTLKLHTNQIGDQGAQALAETLKTNTILTTLDLIWNEISDIGAGALVETLKMNNTLTELNLSNSVIKSNFKSTIDQKLQINIINKKRLCCLQILCLEKLKQLGRISEIKSLNPIIYDSCLMKY